MYGTQKGRAKKKKETYKSQGTVSTHTVTGDTDAAGVKLLRESSKDSLGQLLGDVTVHVVAGVVRSLGGIDVEAGA